MERAWFWEGQVQVALALALEKAGWQVSEVADTEAKAPGIDLLPTVGPRWLAVEVKGYPNTTYDHGPKRGQPKPTQPSNQARQWFSHALLGMMLLRHRRPNAEIALAFPQFATYQSLVERTRLSFEFLGFGVSFITEDGAARLEVPHRPIEQPS